MSSALSGQLPDFRAQGYRVEKTLGHNRQGGRVTYLAGLIETEQPVVIKQFQFAQTGAQWSDYDAHEREIAVLQHLHHPGIPAYLSAFDTDQGFCLVQEYKEAPSLAQALAQSRSFTIAEIEQIAIQVLEVLVYLQQQQPPIIHRDLKPENILVDAHLQVYLVDFGLARIAGEELGASTTVKGTLGFMPPEQLLNRALTPASDLYGLGATLICLLTGTPSTAINELIDETYRISFKPLLPRLPAYFSQWLDQMVAPNLKQRYADAATALAALQARPQPNKLIQNYQVTALAGVVAIALFTWFNSHLFGATHPSPLRQLEVTGTCVGCNLAGADLQGFDLRSVDLTGADLTGADLRQADLRGAYLAGADLTGARIEGAILASTDLRDAIMPDGFIHP